MSEVVFITPTELTAGIRLAGGSVISVRNISEMRDAIETVRQQKDVRMAVLPEHLVVEFEARELRALLTSQSPTFVPLPMDWRGVRDARRDLEDRLRRLLGFRIPVPDRAKHPGAGEGQPALPGAPGPVKEEAGSR